MGTDLEARLTRKGIQTRERLLDTALGLFVENGYEATTMRDIAAAAQSSLGLAYRYFSSKEEMVLSLYMRLAEQMEEEIGVLAPVPIAEGFYRAMQIKLRQLEPYRDVLGALFGVAMMPYSGVAVLGNHTLAIRQRAGTIFFGLTAHATDAPPEPLASELATVLYMLHLALILFWLNDPTPGTRATQDLLALARDVLWWGRQALHLPTMAHTLGRFVQIIRPVFGGLDDIDSQPAILGTQARP